MDLFFLIALTSLLGILVWIFVDKLVKPLLKKVDPYSSRHGGQLVAEVSLYCFFFRGEYWFYSRYYNYNDNLLLSYSYSPCAVLVVVIPAVVVVVVVVVVFIVVVVVPVVVVVFIHSEHLCESQAPSWGQSQLKQRNIFINKSQITKHIDDYYYHLGESPSRRWSGKPCWKAPQCTQKMRISSTFLNSEHDDDDE